MDKSKIINLPIAYYFMEKLHQLTLTPEQQALVTKVHTFTELPTILKRLGLERSRPVLVIVGGANGITDDYMQCLSTLFTEKIAPLVEKLGAAVIDGGTDAGVMRLIGQARAKIKGTFPLIGVAALGTIKFPMSPATVQAAPPEPNHTHFVLVPGNEWGAECEWIAEVATILSDNYPSVTILVNGGKIAFQDVTESIEAQRPVLVVAGSGRTADILASALKGESFDQLAQNLAASGLLKAIDPTYNAYELVRILTNLLNYKSGNIEDCKEYLKVLV